MIQHILKFICRQKADRTWKYDQHPNTMVFTTKRVLNRIEPITLVCHDADDYYWQFIGRSGAREEECKVVCLKCIVEMDSSVLEVSDMPPGWEAERRYPGYAWKRKRMEEEAPEPGDASNTHSPSAQGVCDRGCSAEKNKMEILIQQAIKGEINLDDARAYCEMKTIQLSDLWNIMSLQIAREFHAGNLSYEDSDVAVNSIYIKMLPGELEDEFILPEPAYSIFNAFDQGEFDHGDGSNPVETITKPQIEKILKEAEPEK
jgi:hypothetical protein